MILADSQAKADPKTLKPTKYYEDFLQYHKKASILQAQCNLGTLLYLESNINDDLMMHVELYDVVNRKYAGFTKILHDLWHGDNKTHPYSHKLNAKQKAVCDAIPNSTRYNWGLEEWLFIFLVHRLTGSGINYSQNPSGYYNSILPFFGACDKMLQMVELIKQWQSPMFSSIGYQIAAFPKPQPAYKTAGKCYLCEDLPKLVLELVVLLNTGKQHTLRELHNFMCQWNKQRGYRAFAFQFAATVSDIADFYPEFVNRESHFLYGTNAIECLSYLFEKPSKSGTIPFMDAIMERIWLDTGSIPYDAEDIACDYIRYVENYIRPGEAYGHLDLDTIWNNGLIKDHPYGRQKGMLELGLLDSFNNLDGHPSDNKILELAGLDVTTYKNKLGIS